MKDFRRLIFSKEIAYYSDFNHEFNDWLKDSMGADEEVFSITKIHEDKYEVWVKEI